MRTIVRFFVSYARRDLRLADGFLEILDEQSRPSRRFDFKLWRDGRVLAGEDWHAEIQAALREADLGLLLVSPAFLGSRYIRREELPRLLGSGGKPVIPVLLKPVSEAHDLQGLRRLQIFRLEDPAWKLSKAFSECQGSHRTRFVRELYEQIERRLEKCLPTTP